MTSPQTVPLGSVADINPSQLGAVYKDDELVDFVPMAAVDANASVVSSQGTRPYSEVKKGYTFFKDEDILLAKITPCFENGKISQIRTKVTNAGFGSTEFHVLRPHPEKLDARYLVHYLRQEKIRIAGERRMTGSAGQRRVPKSFLELLPIFLPSSAGQRRIATILDKAESLRGKRQKAIAELDNLAQAIFIEMFGDPIENDRNWTMGPVSDFVSGFEAGKNLMASEDESSSKFRVLKISAITSLEYQPEQSKPLPSEYQPPVSHFVHPGDLLFSRANTKELIGATAYVDETPKNIVLPDKLWRFSWFNPPRAELFYVRHLFRQPRFREEIGRRATGTSGSMQNISQGKVLSITVGQPTLTLQKQFAERIKIIEAVKRKHRTAMAEFGNLFSALQTRAFQGEL